MATKFALPSNANPKCRSCNTTVYANEALQYDGITWHKNCFRCVSCKSTVSLRAVAMMNSELFCKNCFKRMFTEKGNYKFGDNINEAAGNLNDASPATSPRPRSVTAPPAPAAGAGGRRQSLTHCAVADCSIFRMPGKQYCVRHVNQQHNAPAPAAHGADQDKGRSAADSTGPNVAQAASPVSSPSALVVKSPSSVSFAASPTQASPVSLVAVPTSVVKETSRDSITTNKDGSVTVSHYEQKTVTSVETTPVRKSQSVSKDLNTAALNGGPTSVEDTVKSLQQQVSNQASEIKQLRDMIVTMQAEMSLLKSRLPANR